MMVKAYFDCASSPLTRGVNLIEASAGTGKTYAIAMLVLRAVAELGVPVEKILVVTFTKAATEELKGRIRERLLQARNLLGGQPAADDNTMADWVATVQDRGQVLKRLQLALYDIDRASIFTIHSFCQRMLQEQALESGQFFEVELMADTASVRTQVVEDFWRKTIYPLTPRIYSILSERDWTAPEKLYGSIAAAGSGFDRIEPETGSLAEAISEFETTFAAMQAWWRRGAPKLREIFSAGDGQGSFKQKFSEQLHDWWQSLEDYFSEQTLLLPENIRCLTREGLLEALDGRKIRGREKQLAHIADWPLPDIEGTAFYQAVESICMTVRALLVKDLDAEVSERLFSRGRMSYDDLIRRLDNGLREGGDELESIIGRRYEVALIDEFQDTDGAQWRIFSKLFGGGSHHMYLIGDPKQAIYKFRGADIYSYFSARASARKRLTLQKNYRSHPALVVQVNRLFQLRRNPFGYEDEKLPFYPVEAAKTASDGELYLNGRKQPVMVCWQLASNSEKGSGKWSSGAAGKAFCRETVSEILRLLDPADPVEYRTSAGGGKSRPLQPQDIAILVRSHKHGGLYQQALAEVGVPAIVSSKRSVFETEECRELYRLLQAFIAPGNGLLVKSAMTISWFGLSGNELQQIWEEDEKVEEWFSRFRMYSDMWKEKGFLTMITGCLEIERVYQTLAERPLAERRIANIQHLVELVQDAAQEENLGPDQTLLWLDSRLAGEAGGEDVEMRLESDEEAVRIVTMHSAKGLQYAVVFCPYLWHRDNHLKSEKGLVRCHDESGRLVVDLGTTRFEERKADAMQEELAEELRLLYVAVTRAELKCYLMWAETTGNKYVSDSFQSALGYLLFDTKKKGFDGQCDVLRDFGSGEWAEYELITGDRASPAFFRRANRCGNGLSALAAGKRTIHSDYQMSSYSAMASLSEREDHGVEPGALGGEPGSGGAIPHTGLPAGAGFGNLVHDSLENLSFQELAEGEDRDGCVERLCSRYGGDVKASAVMELLKTVVNTPLAAPGLGGSFSLSEVGDDRCIKEMPFYFRLSHVETERINRVLHSEPAVIPLSNKGMQGYLTGFVDLVCEHGGKFYILDYKTNYLGESLDDYRGDSLVRAMASHNYGLQYWIYTLILHRFLLNVKEGYRYSTHFGGVMYLFVRGMTPALPGSGLYFDLPDHETLMELDHLLGGKQ